MHPHDKLAILTAMAKIPGLADLDIPVEDICDAGELGPLETAMNEGFEAALAVDIGSIVASTATVIRPPTPALVPRVESLRTTIRIPGPVLKKYQDRARLTGTRYQSLIIKTLKTAASDW